MKQIAKLSGLAYLMIFIGGFYANFAVLEGLVEIGNPSITTANFIDHHQQFGYGLLGFVVMLVFDLFLVGSLFYLTKVVGKQLSYLASAFRLMHALFFCWALFGLWKVYQLTAIASNTAEVQDVVMRALSDFDILWTLGLLFFGAHLMLLGYLALKSGYVPKIIGWFLIQAALGYLLDGTAKLTLDNYGVYQTYFEAGVVLTGVVGELSFTLWLLYKGFKKGVFQLPLA